MSIKGFQIGEGSVQKYDYTELDNKPTVPVVDATLTTTGAAADAKATGDAVTELLSAISQVVYEYTSKNLYDKDTCNPQDGKVYNSKGTALVNSSSYAVTGKIPVLPNTQYIFSVGGLARIKYLVQFKGESGGTFISETQIDGASFTTGSETTYVDFELFATSHTSEQYEAAINAAQLELGDTASSYEPYGATSGFALPATSEDVGKVLTVKEVKNNKAIDWEFTEPSGGEGGGSAETDKTLTQEDVPADAKAVGDNLDEIAPLTLSKNLYNSAACNPQDGKLYGNNGSLVDGAKYAITGKIPVEPNTQYIFSTGGLATVKYADYFSGDTGGTWISEATLNGAAFTTPNNCTFIDVVLFATAHTTEQFNAAINASQLERGSVATDFVPYSQTRKVLTESLIDAEAVEGSKNAIITASLVNLYDKSKAEDNKVFNESQGKTVSNAKYAFSGLVPVEPNSQYNFSIQKGLSAGYISSWYQRWDSNKTFIDEVQGHQSTNYINQIQTTSSTAYISFNIYFNASHTTEAFNNAIDTVMVVKGMQRPAEYVAYNAEPVVNHLKLDSMYQDNADRFKGKKWIAFGTSVTYQDSKAYTEGVAQGEVVRGYVGDIARRKSMVITNSGVSGSTLAGSDTNALINRYQNYTYTDYDFVTIEYGINDFGNDVPVGTASDAAGTGSFASCLKTIIEYILTENPIIGLVICTDPDVRGTTQNNNNNTLKDYADVTLEIAAQYRLPVCDWFYHSGINAITKGNGTSRYFLTQSGTHPSEYGHMRMGAMLNQVFDSLVC